MINEEEEVKKTRLCQRRWGVSSVVWVFTVGGEWDDLCGKGVGMQSVHCREKCKDMQGKGNGERVMFMGTVMLQVAAVKPADGRAPADLGGAELDLKTFSSVSVLVQKQFFSCQDFHIVHVFWGLFLSSNLPWKPLSFFVLTKCSLIGCCPLSYLKLSLFFLRFWGKKYIQCLQPVFSFSALLSHCTYILAEVDFFFLFWEWKRRG